MQDDMLDHNRPGDPQEQVYGPVPEEEPRQQAVERLATGRQYFQESGCQAGCARLREVLESEGGSRFKGMYEISSQNRYLRDLHADELSGVEFVWDSPGGVRNVFAIRVKEDATLEFRGAEGGIQVPASQWRSNPSSLHRALEYVFLHPYVFRARG